MFLKNIPFEKIFFKIFHVPSFYRLIFLLYRHKFYYTIKIFFLTLPDMKKKKSKKLSQENPNQLSLEFLFKETSIDVHVPKSATTVFNIQLTSTKRLAIQLAES